MDVLVLDPSEQESLIQRRQATDADRFDEVWDGVYVVSPNPNIEHQDLGLSLAMVLKMAINWSGLGHVFAGVNISNREDDWTSNFRIPDVAVFLNGNPARNRDTHWLGGPDFAVEIISPGDRSREKRPFYASVGTRELLVIDRDPWALELYRLEDKELVLAGKSTLERPTVLASAVLPLSMRFVAGEPRPEIEITHADGVQRWVV